MLSPPTHSLILFYLSLPSKSSSATWISTQTAELHGPGEQPEGAWNHCKLQRRAKSYKQIWHSQENSLHVWLIWLQMSSWQEPLHLLEAAAHTPLLTLFLPNTIPESNTEYAQQIKGKII